MAGRTRKRLLPLEAMMLLQVVVYSLALFLASGYAYREMKNSSDLFDTTHRETKATLEEVQAALKQRIRIHTRLLEINHSVNSFEAEFELLTIDPQRTDDHVIKIIQELNEHHRYLQEFGQALPIGTLESLLENIGVVLDIGDELLVTFGFNYRFQLFRDTVDPIDELSHSIDLTTRQFAAENNKLSNRLVARMDKADQDLSHFHSRSSRLTEVILVTAIVVTIFVIAMQVLFFRSLKSRFRMLENYADEISLEIFNPPPLKARDQTGHLAVRLALMGRRIKRLLRISREEGRRADNALKEVEKLAYYDNLTGLENRRLFNQHLNDAFEHAKRYKEKSYLLLIDLDNFKNINDALGHDVGDELLKKQAKRLKRILRSSDHLARLDGDEFGIIAYHQFDRGLKLLRRIEENLRQPTVINQQEIEVTVSIGITQIVTDGIQVSDLMRRADLAMYQAKVEGRNTYQFFSQAMQVRANQKMDLTRDLRNAVKKSQLQLFYQPQINLSNGKLEGAEALIRWLHPKRGMIPPDIFIPIAEETGLINEIGEWVIETACKDAMNYQHQRNPLTMAVNISAHQFYGRSLVKFIVDVLEKTGLPPNRLEIEITEGILLKDIKHAIDLLKQFRELGIRISLDDFGTGYSSLSYLRQLPIDVLKIDRSFISNMFEHAKDSAIVSTIIELAHHMELTVVAEGIETQREAEFLRDNDCQLGQGYLFARPEPIEKLLDSTAKTTQIYQFRSDQVVNS